MFNILYLEDRLERCRKLKYIPPQRILPLAVSSDEKLRAFKGGRNIPRQAGPPAEEARFLQPSVICWTRIARTHDFKKFQLVGPDPVGTTRGIRCVPIPALVPGSRPGPVRVHSKSRMIAHLPAAGPTVTRHDSKSQPAAAGLPGCGTELRQSELRPGGA